MDIKRLCALKNAYLEFVHSQDVADVTFLVNKEHSEYLIELFKTNSLGSVKHYGTYDLNIITIFKDDKDITLYAEGLYFDGSTDVKWHESKMLVAFKEVMEEQTVASLRLCADRLVEL